MSLILLLCPETGFHYSTGLDGDRHTFKLNQDAFAECPHCNRFHRWTQRDVVWVESDSWSEDPQTENCYIKAQEGAEKAKAAGTQEDRHFWQKVEKKWLHLANGYSLIAETRKKR